jgi:hypothetical protein
MEKVNVDNVEVNAKELIKQIETGSDNLSDNKVNTTIDPDTYGNNVYISICSCSLHCCVS